MGIAEDLANKAEMQMVGKGTWSGRTYCSIHKEVEFDAGHRVPTHQSKCRNPHGHRYRIRAVCKGHIIEEEGAPDQGMLIDFGDLKGFLTEHVHDVLDHGFIVYQTDWDMLQALGQASFNTLDREWELTPGYKHGWKVIIFPYIPTAENIARWCWERLEPLISSHFRGNLVLEEIVIWETPTSVAYFRGGKA